MRQKIEAALINKARPLFAGFPEDQGEAHATILSSHPRMSSKVSATRGTLNFAGKTAQPGSAGRHGERHSCEHKHNNENDRNLKLPPAGACVVGAYAPAGLMAENFFLSLPGTSKLDLSPPSA